MSKNIWHTKDETPSKESRVFWKSGNLVYGGRFDTYYKCFCGPASQFVDLRKVSCWCYIDDFLALETENEDLSDKIGKLETELDRTRKALDAAKEGLKRIDWCATDYGVAQDILDEITALEQKKVK